MLRNKSYIGSFFLIFFVFILGCSLARAEGVKERMLARLPEIDSMKSRGIIGENNQGYLEFRDTDRSNAKVVAEENADRRKVYEAIAKQQKTTVELVGSRRALQIEQNAPSGTWLQSSDGSWSKKP